MFPVDIMGRGRLWATGLMSLDTYLNLQFWAAAIVLAGCFAQLHVDKKFRYPLAPGRLTILGYCIGIHLRSAWLSLRLGDLGAYADFVMALVGRAGVALQAVVAVFAMDDVMAEPTSSRPLATFLLVSIVMIQARALSAYTPRERI